MVDKLEQHVVVAGPPIVLILLELKVTTVAAVTLVCAEHHGAADIEQDQNLELGIDFSFESLHTAIVQLMAAQYIADELLELSEVTMACETIHCLGQISDILLA